MFFLCTFFLLSSFLFFLNGRIGKNPFLVVGARAAPTWRITFSFQIRNWFWVMKLWVGLFKGDSIIPNKNPLECVGEYGRWKAKNWFIIGPLSLTSHSSFQAARRHVVKIMELSHHFQISAFKDPHPPLANFPPFHYWFFHPIFSRNIRQLFMKTCLFHFFSYITKRYI